MCSTDAAVVAGNLNHKEFENWRDITSRLASLAWGIRTF